MKLIELSEVKMSPNTTSQQENINEVLVGFEVECILNIENTTRLTSVKQLLLMDEDDYLEQIEVNSHKILDRIHNEIEEQIVDYLPEDSIQKIVNDSSIHGYCLGEVPAEIITNPLPYQQSIDVLQQLFKILKSRYNMRTLRCCSLHVNISCDGTRNQSIDLMKLVAFLDSDHFTKLFDRNKNKYTRSINNIFNILSPSDFEKPNANTLAKLTNNKEDLFEFITKYFSINVNKLSSGYLEIRIIGGQDYENKIKQIQLSISHFVHAILIASGKDHQQEYLTKLTKLLHKFKQRDLYAKSIWSTEEQLILSLIFKKYPYLNNEFLGYSELKEIIKLHFKPEMLKGLSPFKQKQILKYIQDNFLVKRSIKTKSDIDFLLHIMEKIGVSDMEHIYDGEYLNLNHVIRTFLDHLNHKPDNKYELYAGIVHILTSQEIKRMVDIFVSFACDSANNIALRSRIESFMINMSRFTKLTHSEPNKQINTGGND